MNEFFGTAFSQEDLERRRHSIRGHHHPQQNVQLQGMQMAGPGQNNVGMGMNAMVGGDTLGDIIMQNNNEMQRQQSIQQSYPPQGLDRRQSMMEYGSNNGVMNNFGYGSNMIQDPSIRRQSAGQVDMNNPYPDMDPGMMNQQMGYQQVTNNISMDVNGQYSSMAGNMGMMGYGTMGMDGMTDEDANAMNMFSANNFAYPTTSMGSMGENYMSSNLHNSGFSRNHGNMGLSREDSNDMMPAVSMASSSMINSPQSIAMSHGLSSYASPISTEPPQTQSLVTTRESLKPSRSVSRSTLQDSSETPPPKSEPKTPNYQGIYSQSGFDMLGALMKVATREHAEIDIGKVDMSCAFVVCDITLDDCPIIYVSDIFERLTGYTKFEVLGRNCRFLQSPEGKVQGGAHREFVDNDSVFYLKNRISAQKEAQRSLINYRKGGQPFMNLLTMIPITGEDNKDIRYFVGFQVDLVEKPTSVEGRSTSGMYTVNYKQGTLPQYVWHPPENTRPDGGQTVSRDDVTLVLANINSKNESDLTKRMWDKVLLENTDDVVHVLSLKGLFLYLSPSSRKVLEYDSSELVGTALSSVCHPSDIVPVTRELKDTSAGASVNIVFRFRRKKSGYTWFESHGSLCVEQGKGRKCIILVGRERPVYALFRHDIEAAGGIGEAEIWTKLSTSGMFLYVSSNVKNLLDRSPEELVGTSIQALMRPESREQFGRSLEKARTGKRTTHKHEIINKRGLTLQAQTTLYPGDASEGQKPTFLVAQTRMLKINRNPANLAIANPISNKSLIAAGRSNVSDSNSHSNPTSVSPTLSQGELGSLAHPNNLPSITHSGGAGLVIGTQDQALASEDNIFDELKTTRCTSWQFELRQMEKSNRLLAEELAALLANKKKRKRRRPGHVQRDCANCHTRVTPEWRRGPSGQRDLCNSCGLRWAKQTGRVSPRTSRAGDAKNGTTKSNSASPVGFSPGNSPLSKDPQIFHSANNPNLNTNERTMGDVKGENAAMPESLGGRSTMQSMPFHEPSVGYRGGGQRGITNIAEGNEGFV